MTGLKDALEDLSNRYREAEKFEIRLHPSDRNQLVAQVLEDDSPLRGHDYLFDKSVPAGSACILIKLQTIVSVKL